MCIRDRDYFFRFWFRYIYPNSSLIEIGKPEIVLDIIKKDFDKYLDTIFEDISTELLRNLSLNGKLPLFTKWGKWWRMDYEIGIVATNEATGDILFCECKWEDEETDKTVLEELLEKSAKVEWGDEKRNNHYAVVSRKGFTEEAKGFADKNKIQTYDFKELSRKAIQSQKNNHKLNNPPAN